MVADLLPRVHPFVDEPNKDSYGFRSSVKLVGLTAFLAIFTDGFLYSALIPVLPYCLEDRFGVAEKDVPFWLSTTLVAFGLAYGLSSPFVGWMCGQFRSTKVSFFIAQGLALLATSMLCFSRSVCILELARCLQGVSACTIYISAIGMVIESVDKCSRGVWVGLAMTGLSIGTIISPLIGGLIYEHGGFHALFYMTLGLIGVTSSLRLLVINPNIEPDAQANRTTQSFIHQDLDQNKSTSRCQDDHVDEETSLLGQHSKHTTKLAANFPTTAIILSSTQLRAALLGGFAHTTIITSFDAVLPRMVQQTFHWGSALAGAIFLAIALPSVLSSAAGAVSDKVGPRRTALFGFTLATCGIAPMSLVRHDTSFDKYLLCSLLLVVGIGLTFVLSPLAADVSVESDKLACRHPEVFRHGAFAQTFATFNVGIGIAAALGPALSGFLYSERGWTLVVLVLAILCVLASGAVFRYTSDLEDDDEQS